MYWQHLMKSPSQRERSSPSERHALLPIDEWLIVTDVEHGRRREVAQVPE
jgi:hypothetical protein